MQPPKVRHVAGFTLVEFLVVVFVIACIIAVLLPAVQSAREASRKMTCQNKLRQLGIACHAHHDTANSLPAGVRTSPPLARTSFLFHLLPYLEQSNVYDFAIQEFAEVPHPLNGIQHDTMAQAIGAYNCPSDGFVAGSHLTHSDYNVALTSYIGVNGTNYQTKDGVFFADSRIRMSGITDGTSNTVMIGERPPSPDAWFGWWYVGMGQLESGSLDMLLGAAELNRYGSLLSNCPNGPYPYVRGTGVMCDTPHFWSRHPRGANFLFADGSVRFVEYSSGSLLPDFATRAGEENTVGQ